MLFRLLVLVVRDFVITLSEIAYNVNNNLDEVLQAIVFTVYNGNIFNSSRLVLKVVAGNTQLKLSIHVHVVETTRRIRNSHLYRLPLCRTNIKQFSVFYQGPKFYNSLSTEIVNSSSSVSFKKALKAFFYNTY